MHRSIVSSRGVDFRFGEFEFGSFLGGAFHFEHESPSLGGDFDVVAQRVVTFDAAFDFVPVTGALRDHAVGVLGLGFEPLQTRLLSWRVVVRGSSSGAQRLSSCCPWLK